MLPCIVLASYASNWSTSRGLIQSTKINSEENVHWKTMQKCSQYRITLFGQNMFSLWRLHLRTFPNLVGKQITAWIFVTELGWCLHWSLHVANSNKAPRHSNKIKGKSHLIMSERVVVFSPFKKYFPAKYELHNFWSPVNVVESPPSFYWCFLHFAETKSVKSWLIDFQRMIR